MTEGCPAVAVRDAAAEDLDGLLDLLAELHPRYPGDPGAGDAILAQILTTPNRSLLVASVADELVGTADLIVVPNLTHGGAPWAVVENLVVGGDVRGAGIGRALLEEALRRADAAGCYMVQLLSLKHRVQAHAFYRRLGLEPVAEGFRVYLGDFAPTTAQA